MLKNIVHAGIYVQFIPIFAVPKISLKRRNKNWKKIN